jgi:hypothetical protein
MKPDPVIEEIRQARREMSAECGHDPKRLLQYLRRQEREFQPQIARFKRWARQARLSKRQRLATAA